MLLRRLLKIIKLNHLHEIFKIDKIMSSPTKQILSITDAAAERIKILIAKRDKPTVGIKVGVKQGGCSGLSYTFEYCDQKGEFDETIEDKGVVVIVDPKAVIFIIGTTYSSCIKIRFLSKILIVINFWNAYEILNHRHF